MIVPSPNNGRSNHSQELCPCTWLGERASIKRLDRTRAISWWHNNADDVPSRVCSTSLLAGAKNGKCNLLQDPRSQTHVERQGRLIDDGWSEAATCLLSDFGEPYEILCRSTAQKSVVYNYYSVCSYPATAQLASPRVLGPSNFGSLPFPGETLLP